MTSTPNLQQLRQLRLKFYEKPVVKPAGKKMKFKIIKKPPVDNCPICLEKMADGFMETICKHKFHQSCWDEYISSSTDGVKCPMCRHCITPFIKWDLEYYHSMIDDVEDMAAELMTTNFQYEQITIGFKINRLPTPEIMENGQLNGYECWYNTIFKLGPITDYISLLEYYTGIEISTAMNRYFNQNYQMIHIRTTINPNDSMTPQIHLIRNPIMEDDGKTPKKYQMAEHFDLHAYETFMFYSPQHYINTTVTLDIDTGRWG
tara:strand:- start:766 stop:1548 length:783 start_codon:yes stop_codon:yes gene_type:complete